MFRKFAFIFLTVFCISSVLTAQEEIQLWESQIPGSISNDTVQETKVMERELLVRNVTVPTLKYYPAPKESNSRTSVIICPGGGYTVLAINKEGYKIAEWFNSFGVSAFVLKYRLPNDAIMQDKRFGPLMDAQQAIKVVRKNASKWNLDPQKIGIMGFSAGGHLATTAATHFDQNPSGMDENISSRPDFGIFMYPVISMNEDMEHSGSTRMLLGDNPSKEDRDLFSNYLHINENTPPSFLIHTADDNAVVFEQSIDYYRALIKHGVNATIHIYNSGGHGYGLAKEMGEVSTWPNLCREWMKEMNYID